MGASASASSLRSRRCDRAADFIEGEAAVGYSARSIELQRPLPEKVGHHGAAPAASQIKNRTIPGGKRLLIGNVEGQISDASAFDFDVDDLDAATAELDRLHRLAEAG